MCVPDRHYLQRHVNVNCRRRLLADVDDGAVVRWCWVVVSWLVAAVNEDVVNDDLKTDGDVPGYCYRMRLVVVHMMRLAVDEPGHVESREHKLVVVESVDDRKTDSIR